MVDNNNQNKYSKKMLLQSSTNKADAGHSLGSSLVQLSLTTSMRTPKSRSPQPFIRNDAARPNPNPHPHPHPRPSKQASALSISEEHQNTTILKQIRVILGHKTYVSLLPMIFLYISAGYMPSVFMAAFGAEWFAKRNCHHNADNTNDANDANDASNSNDDNACVYNYSLWTFWSSLFMSLRGVVSFLCASMVGKMSDVYGRKPFLFMHIITNMLPYIPLMFMSNLWPYFALYLFGGLNGSNNSATPVMVAFISDVLPENCRTVGYGLIYMVAGVGLFCGAILAIVVSLVFNDQMNFYIIVALYALQILYVWRCVPESLKPRFRKPYAFRSQQNNVTNICQRCVQCLRNANPFRPLLHISGNPIVLWIAVISFLISLPETGVIDTIIPYILDQMEINDDKRQANLIAGMFILLTGVGMILANALLLPFLKKRWSDYQIVLFGACVITLSMFLLACIAWLPRLFLVGISAFVLSAGFIVFPALSSIVTRSLSKSEQGVGFGIIFAYRGLTFAIAPFAFGYSYRTMKAMGYPQIPYLMASLMCGSSILVIVLKLKRVIQQTEKAPAHIKYSLSSNYNLTPNTGGEFDGDSHFPRSGNTHTDADTGGTEGGDGDTDTDGDGGQVYEEVQQHSSSSTT